MRKLNLILSAGFIFFLFAPVTAHAGPVMLQLTIDNLTKGRAVLSGDLDDTPFGPLEIGSSDEFLQRVAMFEVTGTHWYVKTRLTKLLHEKGDLYNLTAWAQHISNPAPHEGEANPGLMLGGPANISHANIGGVMPLLFGPAGPQNDSHGLLHPGSIDHPDSLRTHIDDLNGLNKGFLTPANQLSFRADLHHTPEPASVLLLSSGLLGLVGFRRKKA